jgi:hypothetical protein
MIARARRRPTLAGEETVAGITAAAFRDDMRERWHRDVWKAQPTLPS